MSQPWEADPTAVLTRRLGKSPTELGTTGAGTAAPTSGSSTTATSPSSDGI